MYELYEPICGCLYGIRVQKRLSTVTVILGDSDNPFFLILTLSAQGFAPQLKKKKAHIYKKAPKARKKQLLR